MTTTTEHYEITKTLELTANDATCKHYFEYEECLCGAVSTEFWYTKEDAQISEDGRISLIYVCEECGFSYVIEISKDGEQYRCAVYVNVTVTKDADGAITGYTGGTEVHNALVTD